ncbi:hypothetical protein phiOC_p288 [Ochrobactrum phage vB_OspM_OC]|nr:hypothetical protein phiOC_p288 [Ochrobactrum phage vB_OspM_OC]
MFCRQESSLISNLSVINQLERNLQFRRTL